MQIFKKILQKYLQRINIRITLKFQKIRTIITEVMAAESYSSNFFRKICKNWPNFEKFSKIFCKNMFVHTKYMLDLNFIKIAQKLDASDTIVIEKNKDRNLEPCALEIMHS